MTQVAQAWMGAPQLESFLQGIGYTTEEMQLKDLPIEASVDPDSKALLVLLRVETEALGFKALPLSKTAVSLLGKIAGLKTAVLKELADDEALLKRVVTHCLKKKQSKVHDVKFGFLPDRILHFFNADPDKAGIDFVAAVRHAANSAGAWFFPTLYETGEFSFLALGPQGVQDPKYGTITPGYTLTYDGGVKLGRFVVYNDHTAYFRAPPSNLKKSKRDPFARLQSAVTGLLVDSSTVAGRWNISTAVLDDPHAVMSKLADAYGISSQVYSAFAQDVPLQGPMPALDAALAVARYGYTKSSQFWQEFAFVAAQKLTQGAGLCPHCGTLK